MSWLFGNKSVSKDIVHIFLYIIGLMKPFKMILKVTGVMSIIMQLIAD